MSATQRWPALESNAPAFTALARSIGIPAPWTVHEVFSLEPELLMMVPQPCRSVILCFPSAKFRDRRPAERVAGETPLFHLWQSDNLGNACGLIALIHSVANIAECRAALTPGSFLAAYLDKAIAQTPAERGAALETNEEIRGSMGTAARAGETAVEEGSVDFHFVAFVRSEKGEVVELDGMMGAPRVHEAGVSEADFLPAVGRVVQEAYFKVAGDDPRFSMLGLCAAEAE